MKKAIIRTLEAECAVSIHRQARKEYVAEMEYYPTPHGEDWVFCIVFDGSGKDFVRRFADYASGFDIDEDVEVWIPYRGTRGVPKSIGTLVANAEWKSNWLNEMAARLGMAV